MEEEKIIYKNYFQGEEIKEDFRENFSSFENNIPPSPPQSFYQEDFLSPVSKKSSLWLKIIIGVILFFALGFFTALATRLWDPLWNPFRPKPEKVIEKMTEKMSKAKTVHNETIFGFNVKNGVNFDLKGKFTGDVDETFSDNLKIYFTTNMEFSMEGISFSVGLESKQIGNTYYLRLVTVPAGPMVEQFLSLLDINLQDLKNQWIKIDNKSFEELLGEEKYKEFLEKQNQEREEQKIMTEKINKIMENRKFYTIKKELPDEKISKTNVYHYLVALDNEETKKVILEIIDEISKNDFFKDQIFDEGENKEFNKEEIVNDLNEFFAKAGEFSADLWIGKKDYYLYRIKGEKTLDLNKFIANRKGQISFGININFSNFDKPVEIKAPEQYKDLGEILGKVVENLKVKENAAKDSRIIYDMVQIKNIARMVYNQKKSYKDLCSNFRVNKNDPVYGNQLKLIEEDIQKTQSKYPFIFLCLSANQSYCVQTDLFSEERGQWCIDAFNSKEIPDGYNCAGNGTALSPYHCPQTPDVVPRQQKPSFFQSSLLESFLNLFKK